MKPTTEQRLRDAFAAAVLVIERTRGLGFDDYLGDVWLRSGVERQLGIVGEALNSVRRTDPAVAEQIPRVHEWIALHHILAHVYDRVDHQIVWDSVEIELPELVETLRAMMGSVPPRSTS